MAKNYTPSASNKEAYDKVTETAVVGTVPPQAVELEQAVLGALMLEKDSIISVQEYVSADAFYTEEHRTIYRAIESLSAELKPIDLYTVTERLKVRKELKKVGGAAYLANLTQKVGSAANVEFHAKIIAQKYVQRELIRSATEIQRRSYDEDQDVTDLIGYAEGEIFKVAEGHVRRSVQNAKDVLAKALAQIEEASKNTSAFNGVPSGFMALDRVTLGWQPSDLVIIAARPSMGKTAFVLSMARNMAIDYESPVAFFSLEMSAVQLMMRLIVAETGLAGNDIKSGRLTPDQWRHLESATRPLGTAPLYIDDTPALSVFEFRSKARRLKMRHDIKIIVIDYLQLMTGNQDSKGNREQEVAFISRTLKAIAKELNVPMIALSQLSRATETRGGSKRPQLSDLRESGAIEQDADIVAFIHRPEYYGINTDENGMPTAGMAEIILAKHRNG
ncbi:MAG: replicative DNA helicase, partial [Alistipes sp.]|nr:replicative DNA helicase [Alistipes sp.]